MKRSVLSLLSATVIVMLFFGCVKNIDRPLPIAEAQSWFNDHVANLSPETPNPNPRTTGVKSPVWASARSIQIAHGPAILVPVKYERSFYATGNSSGDQLYQINSLSHLLIYKDSSHNFHAQLVMALPDSAYRPGAGFRGVIVVDEWNGRPIARYKYDGNSVLAYRLPSSATVAPATFIAVTTTCTVLYGYNYSPDDPANGVYWEETLGCDTYITGSDGGSGPSPGDYGKMPGGGTGSGGTGGPSPAAKIAVISGTNPIADIRDYMKCFDNIPGTDHTYTVTVCVDQPIPGTRATWDTYGDGSSSGDHGSSDGNNPINVGHVFLIMSETTASKTITRNVGFYPLTGVLPISPVDQGQLNNNENHVYNVSLSATVTNAQFSQVLDYINLGNNTGFNYDLNNNNCTTFALNALKAGGVNLPATIGYWPKGHGNNPGDLGEDIRQMTLSPNMSRNTVSNFHPNQGVCY